MIFYSLKDILKALPFFFRYIFKSFPLAYGSIILVMLGVFAEYAVLSLMIPLSGANMMRGDNSSRVIEIWQEIAHYFGLPDVPRTWLWLFLLIFTIRILIGLIQIILNTKIAKNIHAELSSGAFTRVVTDISLQEIYRLSVGYYMRLAGDDSIRVGQVYFSLVQATAALLAAAIGLVVLYVFSPTIFNLTVVFLLLCSVTLGFLIRKLLKLSSESALLASETGTTFIEALNGLRSIRSLSADSYVSERYKISVGRYSKALLFIDIFNNSARTLPGLILLLGALFLVFPTSDYLGNFSVVYFFAVTTMLVRVLTFLGVAVYSGGRAAADIRAVLDLKKIILKSTEKSPLENIKVPLGSVNRIKMSALSFGYATDRPLLTGVSAELNAGKCYALTGPSGSGKSTISDVLLGFLPITFGELSIDDCPIDQVELTSLRRRVILVEQQTRIFSGSVRENIQFGLPASDDNLKLAIETADLVDFIESLPLGVETILDYQGANVSGGQRQRIGIARAIFRRPDVLILDEATSALDILSRNLILARLKVQFKNKILLFITHDDFIIGLVDETWKIKNSKLLIGTNLKNKQ